MPLSNFYLCKHMLLVIIIFVNAIINIVMFLLFKFISFCYRVTASIEVIKHRKTHHVLTITVCVHQAKLNYYKLVMTMCYKDYELKALLTTIKL